MATVTVKPPNTSRQVAIISRSSLVGSAGRSPPFNYRHPHDGTTCWWLGSETALQGPLGTCVTCTANFTVRSTLMRFARRIGLQYRSVFDSIMII